MALETLKGVNEIGGFKVRHFQKRPTCKITDYIVVRHDLNQISFTIQNGPIKENGVNGCQIDQIIQAAGVILDGLNKNINDQWNERAIQYLEHAVTSLKNRTKHRMIRGVEGTNRA